MFDHLFNDFNFFLKIDSYEKAFKALEDIPRSENLAFLEELARRYENLGDALPLYQDSELRELALNCYRQSKQLYQQAQINSRAQFIDELLRSDEIFSKSINDIKNQLRRKVRLKI
ncbi:MAG: hypothetical protein ACP5FK_05660 [bacterium]